MLQHRLATPVIQPRMHFFDKDGKPLIGGKVYSFKVGTEEFKPTYRNSELTAANQNPILLDQAGSALIYLRGSNLLKVYDKDGNHIENRIEHQQHERAQFYDDYGKPLKNGFVYTYDYQSTIRKTSYSIDNVINPNPIVLDENGTALVNIVGAYRLRQYNSNNVFVGDQDFKRPPIKALTSVVYPIYFDEGVVTSFSMMSGEQRVVMNESTLNENLGAAFALTAAMARDPLNTCTLEIEEIQMNFAIKSVTQRGALNTASINESLNASFAVLRVSNKSVLVVNTMQPESINASFAIAGAQIKN